MLKKCGIVTAITTALVVGGGLSSVDASASTNNSTNLLESLSQVDNNGHADDQAFGQAGNQAKQDQSQEKELTKNKANHDQQTEKKQDEDNAEDNNEEQESDKENQTDEKTEGLSEFEQEVVDLTNEEREDHGLSPLEADTELSEVARDKSKDMSDNNYFSHDSPNYGSPFDMLETYDVDYQTAGENIARGQPSAEEVVDGWMNSEGHRENILKDDFTHIGVGHAEGGDYWTQEFTG